MEFKNEDGMFFKHIKNFLKKGHFLSWRFFQMGILALFFIISLAYFIHFRDIRIDHLKINSIAKKYILAETSFEFPDIEATRLLKEEGLRDLGRIYHIDDQKVEQIAQNNLNILIQKGSWRKGLPSVTFEELLKANEAIRCVLLKIRFTDIRTASKMTRYLPSVHQFLIFEVGEEKTPFSSEMWDRVVYYAFTDSSEAAKYIVDLYKKQTLSLSEDLALENSLRQLLKDSIPLKMTRVEAGSRIINAGDRVTPRHLNMLKGMKKQLLEQQWLINSFTMSGSLAIATILSFIGFFYFRTIFPQITQSISKMSLIVAVILMTLFISKLAEHVWLNQGGYLSDLYKYPIFVLFAMLTLSILLNKAIALIVCAFIALILNVALTLEYHSFLLINFSLAALGTILVKKITKRKEIFKICFRAWLIIVPFIVVPYFFEHIYFHQKILIEISTALFLIGGVGSLTIILLPFLESAFDIVTDMTLMETSDPNHPLLRRLNQEAPGTYQHSLRVAALAEEAAIAIQGNGLFCRVAGLYHDVGKLIHPSYFTENQFTGLNVHQLLTPYESAQIIIDHVKEGVRLAREYRLPLSIIDVIYQHHGTSLVYYFYHDQIKKSQENLNTVEEKYFRYPGPEPTTREAAIIMLADCAESASRSMEEVTETALTTLIENLVVDKIRDHQLDHSQLTFDEIELIKKSLVRNLIVNEHKRIKYPSLDEVRSWKTIEAASQLN